MHDLELALWLPTHPRRPFVRVSQEKLVAALVAAGFSPPDAQSVVHAWLQLLNNEMRSR